MQPAEAAAQFEEIVKASPNDPLAHANLGIALAKSGRREEAVAHLNQALQLRPNFPEAEAELRALTAPPH
jgi:Flp pilus assembly protein TadD